MSTAPTHNPLAPWRVGDVWENARTGLRLEVEQSATASGGASLSWRATYRAFSPEPPMHLHPQQQEHFEVIDGLLRVRHLGRIHDYGPGSSFLIAPGEAHALWNPLGGPALVRWETRPALRTEAWMGMLLALAAAGRVNAEGVPDLVQLAVLLRAYAREIRLARPSPAVQRIVFGTLAAYGRWRGMRGDRVPARPGTGTSAA